MKKSNKERNTACNAVGAPDLFWSELVPKTSAGDKQVCTVARDSCDSMEMLCSLFHVSQPPKTLF